MTMPVYAVTGASGHLGRFAIEQFLARGVPPSHVVAVVRNRGKATSLAARGVQVREADYSRPQTLGGALAGVDQLLLVSSSELGQLAAQHSNVITAARTAGVSHIAYTSMVNADDSASPLAGEHRDTERVLREAGVPYTLLRNGYYTEVYTDPLGQYLQAGRSSAPPATARSRRPPARTMPPPPRPHSFTTTGGPGPTSWAARPSACPVRPGHQGHHRDEGDLP